MRLVTALALGVFLATSCLSSPSWASRQMLLKVVGSIESHILTTRDVESSFIVDRALYKESAQDQIKYGTEEFASALNRLLIEYMVNEEAQVFGVAKVSEKEIDDEVATVKQKIQSHAPSKNRWSALDLNDEHLKEMVSRKLRANRFIKYKSNSSYVQVSDEEAREYFEKNRLKFGTLDYDNFKNNIKKFLSKKNAEDRLRDWLEVLKKKHKVKNILAENMSHPHEVK